MQNPTLPKWSLMVVDGYSVGPVRGAEIVIRTSRLSHLWIDTPYRAELRRAVGMDRFEDIARLESRFRCLDLEYLGSNLLGPIQDPYGWCSWHGSVSCHDIDVGPDATVRGLEQEWRRIAAEWPFLSLRCQLFDRSRDEPDPKPIVEYLVMDGAVGAQFRGIDPLPIPDEDESYRDTQRFFRRLFQSRPCSVETFRYAIWDLENRFPEVY